VLWEKSVFSNRSGLAVCSVSVEAGFWEGLKEIAKQRHEGLPQVVASIDADRQHADLSSAIRLYVLRFLSRSAPAPSRPRRFDHPEPQLQWLETKDAFP
jgi:predicted DNA-binding ribbon-helix-helix protein